MPDGKLQVRNSRRKRLVSFLVWIVAFHQTPEKDI